MLSFEDVLNVLKIKSFKLNLCFVNFKGNSSLSAVSWTCSEYNVLEIYG